ncbi:hypothetical protein QAD02_011910 [Eretmocerus hayati]|uniref:Uncharacterized protein n=1 Tax=Eretmocerus hayati TaxID=131215 RepID=A0ACC2NYG8_9HYME|nr:hypothetical protein QAD02_011910 [Eretmocerus hayati]
MIHFFNSCSYAVVIRENVLPEAEDPEVRELIYMMNQEDRKLHSIMKRKDKISRLMDEFMNLGGLLKKKIEAESTAQIQSSRRKLDSMRTEINRKLEDLAHDFENFIDDDECPDDCKLSNVYKKCGKYVEIEPLKNKYLGVGTSLRGASNFVTHEVLANGKKQNATDFIQCCKMNHTEIIYDTVTEMYRKQGFVINLADKNAKCHFYGLKNPRPVVHEQTNVFESNPLDMRQYILEELNPISDGNPNGGPDFIYVFQDPLQSKQRRYRRNTRKSMMNFFDNLIRY